MSRSEPDLERAAPGDGLGRAHDELGRAAADVAHGNTVGEATRRGDRTRKRQPALFVGGEDARPHPGGPLERREELTGVRALAARSGDDHVDVDRPELAGQPRVRAAALGRLGHLQLAETPGALDLVAEPEQRALLVNGQHALRAGGGAPGGGPSSSRRR